MDSQTQAWLTKLQAQPWYGAAEAQFKAANIADPLWESTLAVEDSGLDPSVVITDTNGAQSVGLFQLNKLGLGAGYANSTLQDPGTNAGIAARAMAARLIQDHTTNAALPTQLQSIEMAGWPGADPKLPQDASRQAALSAITSTSSDWLVPPNPAIGFPGLAKNPFYAGQNSIPAAITGGPGQAPSWPTTEQINAWLQQAVIGSVLLAMITGGFVLLAAPAVENAAEHMPVPV